MTVMKMLYVQMYVPDILSVSVMTDMQGMESIVQVGSRMYQFINL
jgi:hypothetical protein